MKIANVCGNVAVLALLAAPFPLASQHERSVVALNGEIGVSPAPGSVLGRRAGLEVAGVSIADALARLSESAGVSVAFSPNSLPGELRVDCACQDATLAQALDSILARTAFGYLELGDQVVVSRRIARPALQLLALPGSHIATPGLSRGPAGDHGGSARFLADPPALHAPQERVIVGTVVDARTGAPILGAQIVLAGTRTGTLSAETGRFRLPAPPGATADLEVTMMGYRSHRQTVPIGAAEVRIALTEAALELDALVVTAAGMARAREVGNSLARITSREIDAAAARTTQDLLSGRAPGVMVMRNGGQPGTGGEILLRGINSVSQGNLPIFYVDGVRVVGRSAAQHPGARVVGSPLDDINPADIERIEVVMGAAATTLYGTEASGGVIQVFTKKGQEGAARWTAEVTAGMSNVGHLGPKEGNPTGLYVNRCRGEGLASFDGRTFEDPTCPESGSWVRNAPLQRYSLSVAGGSSLMSYFVSGNWSDEQSVVFGDFGARSGGVRTNLSIRPREALEVALNTSYSRTNLDLFPDGEGNDAFLVNVTRGLGGNYAGAAGCSPGVAVCVQNGENLKTENFSYSDRFLIGAHVTHQAGSVSNRVAVGYHFSQSDMARVRRFGHAQYPLGQIHGTDIKETKLSFDYSGSIKNEIGRTLTSTFAWGGQAFADGLRVVTSSGLDFSGPGIPTLTSAARRDVTERRERVVNAGLFVQEMLAWRETLFLTAGVRVDGNSAFGSGFGLQAYPKASVSYVVSESGFWPRNGWVDDLKLRAAVGEAGKAPGAFDAVRTWLPAPGDNGQPGFVPGQLGNDDLGPERSRELEAGAEVSFLEGRFKVDATVYRQDTYGALIPVLYPPSQGFLNRQLENVGHLRNSGVALRLESRILRSSQVDWRATVDYATTKTKAIDLGGERITIHNTSRTGVREGYPVPGIFGAMITNPDEFAAPVIVADTFIGSAYPDRTISLGSNMTIGGKLTVDVLGEFQLGGHMVNGPAYQNGRAGNYPPCFEIQAKDLASRTGTPNALDDVRARDRARCALNASRVRPEYDWWIESTDYFRLRSVSLTYPIPSRLVPGQGRGSIQVAARNLWTVTDYTGVDPEVDNTPGTLARREYYNFPPYRTFQLTLRLNY